MSGLKKILESSVGHRLEAGGNISRETTAKLQVYRKHQRFIFVVVELVLILGVAICAFYVTQNSLSTTQITMLTGLIGIGAGGGLELARRIWKEWAQSDLLLLLLAEASEAQVNTIVDKLVEKL